MQRVWMLVVLVSLLFSCSKDEEGDNSSEEKIINEFLETNAIDFVHTNGVYQYRIVENPGGATSGNVFSVFYTLTDLVTGEIIDSHLSTDGDPILLLHDADAIFPIGLDRGLFGIREGETYGIIVPGELAYKDNPVADVPKNAILHFEVEVVSRESLATIAADEDNAILDYITVNDLNNTVLNPLDAVASIGDGVYYKRLSAGSGAAPTVGDSVTVNYTGKKLDGSTFDALSGFKYKYGAGKVIAGFDKGVGQMDVAEEALIIIPSAQGYGGSVRVIPQSATEELVDQLAIPTYTARVRPFEVLIFEVTLQTIH